MQLKQLQETARQIVSMIDKKNPSESAVLINTLKVVEEIGELSEDVINLYSGQRKRKDKNEQELKENIAIEIADIIIVLAILSERLGLDLEDAVAKKCNKEKQRWISE
jgi:NTP pyrophosphatase (non-canonical NTP hydrolase)